MANLRVPKAPATFNQDEQRRWNEMSRIIEEQAKKINELETRVFTLENP